MSLIVMYLVGALVDGLARLGAFLWRAAWVAVGWVAVAAALNGCATTIALPGAP